MATQVSQVELAISARDTATQTLTSLSSAIQQFTQTNENAADRARASSQEYQQITSALNTLKQSLSDMTSIQKMARAFQDAENAVRQTNETITASRARMERLAPAIATATAATNQLKEANRESKAEIKALDKALAGYSAEQVEAAQNTKIAIAAEKAKIEANKASIAQLNALNREHDNLGKSISALNSKLHEQVTALGALGAAARSAGVGTDDISASVADMNAQIAKTKAEITTATAALNAYDAALVKAAAEQQRLDAAAAATAESQRKLNEQMHRSKAEAELLAQAQRQIISAAQATNASLEQQQAGIRALTERHRALQSTLHEQKVSLLALQNGMNALGVPTQAQVQRMRELQAQIAATNASIMTEVSALNRLQSANASQVQSQQAAAASARAAAESARIAAENNARAAAESQRLADQLARETAERQRATAAIARQTAEQQVLANSQNQVLAAARATTASLDQQRAGITVLQERQRSLNATLHQQQVEMQLLRNAIAAAGTATTAQAAQEAHLASQIHATNTALATEVQALHNLQTAHAAAAAAARASGSAHAGAASSVNLFGEQSRKAMSVMQRYRGEVYSLAAQFVGLQAAFQQTGSALNSFMTLQGVQAKLSMGVKDGLSSVGDQLDYVKQQAERLGLPIETLNKNYSDLFVSMKQLGFGSDKIRTVFEGISEAASVMQLSVEDVQGVFRATTQIFAKGTIMAEELKGQLGDRFPLAVGLMAQSLGVGTDALFKMMEQGQLTSSAMIGFTKLISEEMSGALVQSVASFRAELNRLGNASNELKLQFGEELAAELVEPMRRLKEVMQDPTTVERLKEIARVMGDVASAAVTVIENIDVLISVLQGFLAIALLKHLESMRLGFLALGAASTAAAAAQAAAAASTTAAAAATATAATNVSRAATVMAGALNILQAAVAGFAIGTMLKEQFLDVELFGIDTAQVITDLAERFSYLVDVLNTPVGLDSISLIADRTEQLKQKLASIPKEYDALREAAIKAREPAVKVSQEAADAARDLALALSDAIEEEKRLGSESTTLEDRQKRLAEAFKVFGLDTSQALGRISPELNKAIQGLEKLYQELEYAGDTPTAKLNAMAMAAGSLVEKLKTTTDVQVFIANVERMGQEGKIAAESVVLLTKAAEEQKLKIDEATPGINSLAEAYKTLGLKAPDALKKTADETKAAYEKLVAHNAELEKQPQILGQISVAGEGVKKALGNVFTDGKEQAADYVQGLQISIANIKAAQVEAIKLRDGTAEGEAKYTEKMNELNASLVTAQAELKKTNEEIKGTGESAKNAAIPLGVIQEAFLKYAEVAIKSNGGVADSALTAKAAQLGLKDAVIAIEQAAIKASPAMKNLDEKYKAMGETVKQEADAVKRGADAHVAAAKIAYDTAKAKGDENEVSRAAAVLAQAEANAAYALAQAKYAEAEAAAAYAEEVARALVLDGAKSEADERAIAASKDKAAALRGEADAQAVAAGVAQDAANVAVESASKVVTATASAGGGMAAVANTVSRSWQGMAQQAGISADQIQKYGDILIDVYDKAAAAQARWLASGQPGTDPMAGLEGSLRQAAEAAQALDDKIAQLKETGSNSNASLIAENLELKGQYEQAAKVRENALLNEIELNIQLIDAEAQRAALAGDDTAYQAAQKRIAVLKEELALTKENIELKKKAAAAEKKPSSTAPSSSGGTIQTTRTESANKTSVDVTIKSDGAGLGSLDRAALDSLARQLAPIIKQQAARGLS